MLGFFNKSCKIRIKNAGGLSRVEGRLEAEFSKGVYNLVFPFVDTECGCAEYQKIKKDIAKYFNPGAEKLVIFSSPCNMLLALNCFSPKTCRKVGKTKCEQGEQLRKLGVSFPDQYYSASENQLRALSKRITVDSYILMKKNIKGLPSDDSKVPATNALSFFEGLENPNSSFFLEAKKLENQIKKR